MANANPSRPGVDSTAGKLQISIPKEEKIVKMDGGRVVRRTEYESGTIRETEVFHEDHMDAPDFVDTAKEEAAAALRAEIEAEVRAEIDAEKKPATKPEPKGKGGK